MTDYSALKNKANVEGLMTMYPPKKCFEDAETPTERAMYMVVDATQTKKSVIWCTTEDFDFLCRFCQYLIDSSYDSSLEDFWIVWKKGDRCKRKRFYEFCEIQEIRKRNFGERNWKNDGGQ